MWHTAQRERLTHTLDETAAPAVRICGATPLKQRISLRTVHSPITYTHSHSPYERT